METVEKALTVTAWVWNDEAAAMLASTLRGVPCYTVEDYRREVELGQATLVRVATAEGETVGYAVLRVEKYAGGAEGVIVAAAGRLPGAKLYDALLPVMEGLFRGVKSIRVDNCRPGALAKLRAAGYVPTHIVMRKAARPSVESKAVRTLQDNLAALAAIDAPMGGGHLCAGPGGRPHKGGSSASSTQQNTTNTDRRQVVDAGSVGVSSDSSTVNVSMLDGGAIYAAQQIANNAIWNNAEVSRQAALSMSAAAALVGEQGMENSRTVAGALDFGRDAFSTSVDATERAVSEALYFAGASAERADDSGRRSMQDALYFAGDAASRADDAGRYAMQEAYTYAGGAAERADDTARRAMQDSLAFAESAFSTVDDNNRRALQESLGFADASAERASDLTWRTFSEAVLFAGDVFDSGLSVLDKAGQQITAQTELVATAYDNAKGEGTQKTYIAAAALAAVAIVAISAYGGKK